MKIKNDWRATMIQPIITDVRKLHKVSTEVDVKKEFSNGLQQLIIDMKDTLREAPNGIGLSAIQIGVPKRVIVMKFSNGVKTELVTYINPLINGGSKELTMSIEGCLSVPNKEYLMIRHQAIDVYYQTPMGDYKSVRMTGLLARAFQHEYDHLSGVIISDAGLEYTDELRMFSKEELAKALADYQTNKAEQAKKKSGKKSKTTKQSGGDNNE